MSIKNSTFFDNEVVKGGFAKAKGTAVFTETILEQEHVVDDPGENISIDYRSDVGVITSGSGKQALSASSRNRDVESSIELTYTFASDDFTSHWHHVATSFANGGTPQGLLRWHSPASH